MIIMRLLQIQIQAFALYKLSEPHRKLNANEGDLGRFESSHGDGGTTQGMEQLKVNTEIDFNLTFAYTESFPLASHE